MISWIVIAVLLVVGIAAIKLNHIRHRVFILLLVTLALFLYATVNLVAQDNNINVENSEGLVNLLKVYNGWLANGFSNLKSLAGNAIKMDWTATNSSFFEEG